MTYASLAQVKSALRIPTTDTVDDSMITLALASVDDMINGYCGRTFGTATTNATRYYAAGKGDAVEIDDIVTIGTVSYARNGTDWTDTTDFQAEPLNGYTDGISFPFTRLRAINSFQWPVVQGTQSVRVTGAWGFGALPSAVVQAAVLQTARVFRRADSPLGVAGWNELGAVRVQPGLDVDVRALLEPYRRYRAAV